MTFHEFHQEILFRAKPDQEALPSGSSTHQSLRWTSQRKEVVSTSGCGFKQNHMLPRVRTLIYLD
ncbi:MAG TPA: hypothetical protein DD646_06405 [Acidimicrobiaceae bacterium]|nr:hypothetical protein [Acidimicrobiaceae bacterium]